MRTRLALVRVATAVALVGVPLLAWSGSAAADAPTATGWWNFATRDGLPKPPPPPDVDDGDLLVQAGDPSGGSAGDTDGSAAPSAVAAVRFTIPANATVEALTFHVADGASATDVRAYSTSDTWKPVQNGALTDAPAPNRSRSSLGVLKGTALTFADIARLVPENGPLSVVILPGATDRVVIRKPGSDALKVSSDESGSASAGGGAVPPPAAFAPSGGSGTDGGSGTALAPSISNGTVPQNPGLGAPDAAPPVVAGPPGAQEPAVVGQPAAARGNVAKADDSRTRYFAATEAALVLVTFGLLGWGPFARLASLFGAGAASDTQDATNPPARGVGRFTRPRHGRVVRL